MRYLINGSIAYDLLLTHDGSFLAGLDVKHLESLSVNFFAHGFVRHHGGTSANISWNLALLGEKPIAVGAVGTDGNEYVTMLKNRGVDTHLVQSSTSSLTATAVIATDSAGRQISFFHPGADTKATFPDLTNEADIAYGIMSPRNPGLMLEGGQSCAAFKIPYLFDPGQVVHAFSDDDLKKAVGASSGLIVNEYEWSIAGKKLSMNEQEVAALCGMIIVTLGEKGLRIVTKKDDIHVPACPISRLANPTGAGDAARAGLLYGFAHAWPLMQSARLAAILGAFVCEQDGTLLDALDRDQLSATALEVYGAKLPF